MLSNSTTPLQLHSTHLYSTRGYSINLKGKSTHTQNYFFTRLYYTITTFLDTAHLFSTLLSFTSTALDLYCIKLRATRPGLSSTQLDPTLKHSFISLSITAARLFSIHLYCSWPAYFMKLHAIWPISKRLIYLLYHWTRLTSSNLYLTLLSLTQLDHYPRTSVVCTHLCQGVGQEMTKYVEIPCA